MNYKKIILAISFLVVFGFLFNTGLPTAKAMTVAEIQAQIAALQSQIAQLQQRLIQLQGAPATWCYDFNRNLKYGNAGEEVRALQTALEKEGFYKKTISGDFDEYTASAVVGFQGKYAAEILAPWGLEYGTGYVGPTTRDKLNKLYGCGITTKSITVLSPNGGEKWEIGKTYVISWAGNISTNKIVEIKLYRGTTYLRTIIDNAPTGSTNGSYLWTISSDIPIANDYKMKVSFWGGPSCPLGQACLPVVYEYSDFSDAPFSIVATTTTATVLIDQLIQLVKQAKDLASKNDSQLPAVLQQMDSLLAQLKPLVSYNTIATALTDQLIQLVKQAKDLASKNDSQLPAVLQQMDSLLAQLKNIISTPSITVLSPNGGEKWEIGKTYEIKWSSQNLPSTGKNIHIHLNKRSLYGEYDTVARTLYTYVKNDRNAISWTIPNDISVDSYKIQIVLSDLPGWTEKFSDISDAPFSIVSATTACTDSDGGKNYYTKGTVIDEGKSYTDYCINNSTLKEYFCLPISALGLGGVAEENYTCPYGCSNGACLKEPAKPDLVVKDIYYDGPYYIKVNYCNYGNASSDSDFLIKIRNDESGKEFPGNSYYRFKVPETGQCAVTGGFTCGLIGLSCGQKATVTAIIDWEQRVNESNENNNTLTKTIGTTISPSIIILSPNGGEKWGVGNTYNIQWVSQNLPAGNDIIISSIQSYTKIEKILFSNLDNSKNNVSWTIPTNTYLGSYVISITAPGLASLGKIADASDGEFSIFAQMGYGLGLESIETQLASISKIVSELMEKIKELIK